MFPLARPAFLPLFLIPLLLSCAADEIQQPSLKPGPDTVSSTAGDARLSEVLVELPTSQSEVDGEVDSSDVKEVEVDVEPEMTDLAPVCMSKADCNDGNLCTQDGCEFASGVCFHDVQFFFPCDDEDPCTVQDRCNKDGVCVGETKVKCFDGNPCTLDTCDKVEGCLFKNVDAPCSDGSACTQDDVCKSGVCAGVLVACNDKEPCTTDTCHVKTGCVFEKENGIPCSDNNACTGGDLCSFGLCKSNPISCGDGNACTVDACDKVSGCYSTPAAPNSPCSDGDACTLKDFCQDSNCKSGTKKPCDDNNVCTADSCQVNDGVCVNQPLPGIHYCDDNNACSNPDVCKLGSCVGQVVQCYDGNDCTKDSCDLKLGCQFLAQDKAPCEDGDKCTIGDNCAKDKCEGKVKTCADANACTNDTCDPAVGKCNFTAMNGFFCDDGSACTVGDVCEGVTCAGGTLACKDGNPCTDDKCNPKTGCFFVPMPNAPCSDDNLCSKDDICNQSVCVGKPIKCDDGSPCTNDGCDKASGACVYAPLKNGYACSDNDLCTFGDICDNGKCAGTVYECNDKKPCTKDACNPQTGKCVNTPIPDCV